MIDSKGLENFLKLPDDEIRKRLEAAARAAGADSSKVRVIMGDTEKLRRVIATLTPEDAERMINMFGKDKAQAIADSLQKDL